MARSSRSSSASSKWRYCHPSYYLKRPKRLALLFIGFVCCSFVVWDRQTLIREHEVKQKKRKKKIAFWVRLIDIFSVWLLKKFEKTKIESWVLQFLVPESIWK
jgi:hypothetical protein